MADTKTNEAKISIKVFVDKIKQRVAYVEADHSFVDILFSFMTLPLGTIVRILEKHADKQFEALGSLNNLYQSLKDFPERYLASEECKSILLNPRSLAHENCRKLKLQIDDTEPLKYYVCSDPLCYLNAFKLRKKGFSTSDTSRCTNCGWSMEWKVSDAHVVDGVFVSDVATFMISDDLRVEPYTSASSIRLLTNCGITDANYLEERKLDMCFNQVLYFLRLALTIDCPFTYMIFSKIHPIRTPFSSCQDSSFDQCDVMKKEASATSKMLLEVSYQKSTGRLLFAEAKEDFIDFLFGFLSIPLGTVVGTLLDGSSSISCMDNLYKSISNMNVGRCIESQGTKDLLLHPHFGQQYTSKNLLFPLEGTLSIIPETIMCERIDPRINEQYLKQSGMFMVTDDLTITPSTSRSTIDILRKLKVRLDDIDRYEVSIGLEEGSKLLNASLRSCSALTEIIKK